jgi:hypothetical protein
MILIKVFGNTNFKQKISKNYINLPILKKLFLEVRALFLFNGFLK